jgi:uncharacterized iron-regulated membrane protein
MTAKKIIGTLHLWLGLATGLVVIIVATTGCLLVFEKEIDESVNHDFYYVQVPTPAQRLPLDKLLHTAKAHNPSFKITRIGIETAEADRSILFMAKKGKQTWLTAVNPYTGQVIRSINYNKRFFTVVLQLHRTLLMNEVGKAITGVSCMIFVFMILTGLVLWWPKRWRTMKQRMAIKWSASRKRLNWDMHAVGGFYVHLVLFAIALTGLTWAYKWFNNSIFLVFDGKPFKKMEAPANKVQQPILAGYYENLYREANERLNYKGKMTILIPEQDSLSVTISKENYDASVSNVTDMLYYEKGTGRLLQDRLYKNASTGMKVRRIVYPIHTGQIYGLPTKIIAFIACLVAVSLPITGLYIWLGRKKKSAKPAKEKLQPVSVEVPQSAVVA